MTKSTTIRSFRSGFQGKGMIRKLMIMAVLMMITRVSHAQCCAGGAGSPIAGGTSQGVLQEHQLELNTNFQWIRSNQFFTGNKKDSTRYFDSFRSSYQYFRVAYGVTDRFTMSVETGNYFNKKETGLNHDESRTYQSRGIGDLILFPRYTILNKASAGCRNEITLGLGVKIPVGSYNDSTGRIEPFSGQTYYVTNPQAVQLSSGAHDIIFYSFFFRSYPNRSLRFFANTLYVKKGWNPLGEKMGDFASIGLFAGKTILDKLNITFQLRGEWMDKMKINEDVLMFAYPNYDPEATGYRKVFFTPQLGFSQGKFTVYGLVDIPLYQYVVKTQVGTGFQATAGVSFRVSASKSMRFNQVPVGKYYCPMHPEVIADEKGTCPKCKMELEKR